MRAIGPLSLVVMLASAGCSAFAPTGKNVAAFPTYRVADEAGKVAVLHTPTADDVASVSFVLRVPEALEIEGNAIEGVATSCTAVDEDAPDDGVDRCAEIDTSALPEGIYPVDIYEDDAEEPASSVTVVVKEALAPEGDEDASGAEEPAE